MNMNAKIEAKQEGKQVRTESDRPQRPERQPLGVPRLKLHAKPIPGYHQCWVNEENLNEYQEAGYDFVVDESQTSNNLGEKIRRLVGKTEGGGPQYAYLMKIEESLWREDQGLVQKKVDMVDAAIRSGIAPGIEAGKSYDKGTKVETR